MAANRLHTTFGRLLLAACLTVAGLMASEHHGIIKSGGIPVPGATVTATQGDKRVVTTSDETGFYSFPDLEDGIWTISVEMLGFEKVSRDVGVAPDAPSPQWELKYQSLEAITAPPPAAVMPAPAASPTPAATATGAATTPPAEKPAGTKAAAPTATAAATPTPAPATAAPAKNAKNAKNAKKGATPATQAAGGTNNGRPSLNAALAGQEQEQGGGFTRLGVSQSGDAGAAEVAPPADTEGGDMAAAGNQSFTINGSVSSGLDTPQQGGDWMMGGGRGGFGGDMGGMGGPGGMPGMGMGGDPTQAAASGDASGGRGGRGGDGGGGRGGGGAMPMIGGGFGGGGGRSGGFGGRNPASFGNNRRNPRSRYNFSASAILTNSALNARNYSITGGDVSKPNTQSIRSTLTAGGPLKIPHVFDTHNKGTFTVNYTLGRNRTGATWNSLVPTAQEWAGNFNGVTGSNGQPITLSSAYPGNQIPASAIGSVAAGLQKYYPVPTPGLTGKYNFADSGSGVGNSDNVNARLSYTFNTKHQMSGGLQWQRSYTTNPSEFAVAIPAWHDYSTNNGVNANVAYIYHFSLRLIATTRYTYSRASALTTPYFANLPGGNVEGNLGIVGTDQYANNWGPPSLSFSGSGILGLSDAQASYSHPQTSAVGESLLWVRGVHEFTFGGDFSRREANTLSQNNPRGSYGFTGGATGYDFADFLIGVPATMALNVANSLSGAQAAQLNPSSYGTLNSPPSGGDRYLRTSVYDVYANDQWRLTPRISLSLGLRWDYQAPTTELYGRLATIDLPANFQINCATFSAYCPSSANYDQGLSVVAGQTGPLTGIKYSDSMLNGQKTDISPRIGFAWKPFAKHSSVLRGGYGLYYVPSVYSNLIGQLDAQTPFATAFNISNTCGINDLRLGLNLATLQSTINPQTRLPCIGKNQATTTNAIDTHFRVGYTQNWQLALQQNLKWNTVATVAYFASKGTGLTQQFYPNSFATTTANKNNPTYPNCPVDSYCPNGYLYETSNGNSSDEGVQLQLQRRLRSGLGGNLSYQLNKAIDDSGGVAQDWTNLAAERARSAGIRGQTLSLSLQYSTGVSARGGGLVNGWKGVLFRDWTVMPMVTLGSGAPITVTASTFVLGGTAATGGIRANYTGQPDYVNGSLNLAAFALPALGSYGNLGRDSLNGPKQFTTSVNANRTFRLADRKNLTFSIQASNPLNHPVVSSWNTSYSPTSNQFGLPQSYVNMRQVTANMRFNF